MTFEIAPTFDTDVDAAIAVYTKRARRDELGFSAEVKRAVRSVRADPRFFAPVEDECPGFEVREYFIKRYGQRMLFLIDGDRVVVFALIHASRRPGGWHRRLGSS